MCVTPFILMEPRTTSTTEHLWNLYQIRKLGKVLNYIFNNKYKMHAFFIAIPLKIKILLCAPFAKWKTMWFKSSVYHIRNECYFASGVANWSTFQCKSLILRTFLVFSLPINFCYNKGRSIILKVFTLSKFFSTHVHGFFKN